MVIKRKKQREQEAEEYDVNDQLPHLTNLSFAQQYLNDNVQPFIPSTNIIRILVGNEVMSTANKLLIVNLVPAMQTLHTALVEASLDQHIKISTPLSLGILSNSSPPSTGKFSGKGSNTWQLSFR